MFPIHKRLERYFSGLPFTFDLYLFNNLKGMFKGLPIKNSEENVSMNKTRRKEGDGWEFTWWKMRYIIISKSRGGGGERRGEKGRSYL